MNQINERVTALITNPLEGMGYELVRVRLSHGGRPVLQVMAERADGAAMTVDDCAEISHSVSVLLDAEDPIIEAYTLEVSSPGIDRPLTRPRDFERFAGFEARIETHDVIAGRRRFKGRLLGLAEGMVSIDVEKETVRLPFEAIGKARLVLTDELSAASGAVRPQA